MVETERTENPWMSSELTETVEINGCDLSLMELTVDDTGGRGFGASQPLQTTNASDEKLGIGERAFSAAGAAFLSAIIVNPLDVAKVLTSSI